MTDFAADSAGLYLHVPFCLSKCDYCGFYSTLPQAGDADRYLARLAEESAARRARCPASISTVFVGGGNPTAPGFSVVRRLVDIIQSWSSPAQPLEITFETNPETLTAEIIDLLAGLPGIRLSIGVQRLDDAELALLGRHARLDAVYRALDLACSRLENVGIDLILGVPGCPPVSAALASLLQRFKVQHVSAYFLTVEENTPMQKRIEGGLWPDPAEIGPEEMYAVRDLLLSQGFEHYEISNFARPGRRCQHNINYWQAGAYIGLGPSAVSCCGNRRSANPPDLQRWLQAQPPALELLSDMDRRNEFLMLNLRLLNDGLALPALVAGFGQQPAEFEQAWLQQVAAGNLKQAGDRLLLTDQGLALADRVLASLFL